MGAVPVAHICTADRSTFVTEANDSYNMIVLQLAQCVV